MPSHEFIVVEIGAGVMTITLNRPDVLNSFNAQMAREVRASLEDARLLIADVRVIDIEQATQEPDDIDRGHRPGPASRHRPPC